MKYVLFLCVLFGISACSLTDSPRTVDAHHVAPCDLKMFTRLYFGTATPTGMVTPEQWQEFLKSEITPRFPAGLSVIDSQGQWRGADEVIVREQSYVVELIYTESPENTQAVAEVIARYKAQFAQEAVLAVYDRLMVCR